MQDTFTQALENASKSIDATRHHIERATAAFEALLNRELNRQLIRDYKENEAALHAAMDDDDARAVQACRATDIRLRSRMVAAFVADNEALDEVVATAGLFGPDVVGIATRETEAPVTPVEKATKYLREQLELERAARKKLEAKVKVLTDDLVKSREMNAEYVVQLTKLAADNAKWQQEPILAPVGIDIKQFNDLIYRLHHKLNSF